ncbi:MAG: hypothetical protein IJD37_04240 [Clostridia bacterium]|nr:hypothetical protein [Clostridia bacterium]
MKKMTLLLILVLIFAVGCTKNDNTLVTVDTVIEVFDLPSYIIQDYSKEQISDIKNKLTLEDDIKKIIHIVNQNTASPDLEWIYVYEFISENDAVSFKENRTQYSETIENGKCVRFGKIVVYGNSDLIDTIGG